MYQLSPCPLHLPSPCSTPLPAELFGLKSIFKLYLTFPRKCYIKQVCEKHICCRNAGEGPVYHLSRYPLCNKEDEGPSNYHCMFKTLKKYSKMPTFLMFGWWVHRCMFYYSLYFCIFLNYFITSTTSLNF